LFHEEVGSDWDPQPCHRFAHRTGH
jgi:hypothetical protein